MLCMLFDSLRHYDFDTFSQETQTSQDPNFIFDTQHTTVHPSRNIAHLHATYLYFLYSLHSIQ